jgi:hypothetical protein
MQKHRVLLAGAVLTLAVVGALALKKGRHDSAQNTVPAAAVGNVAASSSAPLPPDLSPAPPPVLAAAPAPAPAPAPVAAADETSDSSKNAQKKHVRVAPFSNGPVHHGNVLHLKMDGVLESIEGAQQPTGFTVKLPGRKSLEAAAPLAARDSRIAAIKVSNDSAGAELSVTFRDGVPNYRVSAKGDTLVIALAAPGAVDAADVKKDDKSARIAKRTKHPHTGSSEQSP